MPQNTPSDLQDIYDFSIIEDSFFVDEIHHASDRYWTPVDEQSMGSYGQAESIMARAQYWNQGDVGNEIWINERRLPFGDEAYSMILNTGSSLLFLGYEDHWQLQREPSKDPAMDYEIADPAYRWALEEHTLLLQDTVGLMTDSNKQARLAELSAFMDEVKRWSVQITEDPLVNVPDWALDSIAYTVDRAVTDETEIVEEVERIPVALKARVISSTPLMPIQDIEVYEQVDHVLDIEPDGVREWCIALVDGQKLYGPYGHSVGHMKLLTPAGRVNYKEIKQHRTDTLAELLKDHGFSVYIGEGQDAPEVTFNLMISPEEEEDITLLEARYGRMASEISRLSSTLSIIQQQCLLNQDEALMFRIWRKCTKYKVPAEFAKLHELDPKTTVGQWAECYHDVSCFQSLTLSELTEAIEALGSDKLTYSVITKTEEDLDTITYLLQVSKTWGHDTFAITKNPEVARQWRLASGDDLPWFLASSQEQAEYPRPTSFYDEGQVTQLDVNAYEAMFNYYWDSNRKNFAKCKANLSAFNASHKVKAIYPAHLQRNLGLLTNVPLLTSHLTTAKAALAELGAYIVRKRKASARYNEAFTKINAAVRFMLLNEAEDLPHEILAGIAGGKMDIWFSPRTLELPDNIEELVLLIESEIIAEDHSTDTYQHPLVEFTKIFTDHSEVFGIFPGFNFSTKNRRLASEILLELYPDMEENMEPG